MSDHSSCICVACAAEMVPDLLFHELARLWLTLGSADEAFKEFYVGILRLQVDSDQRARMSPEPDTASDCSEENQPSLATGASDGQTSA